MHAILYRGYPSEGLPLNTEKLNRRLCSSQHYYLFPSVRAASNEYYH